MSIISTSKSWVLAIRPPTLLIPTSQIMISTALASAFTLHINWAIAFGAWLVALLITIGTNLINDVIDFEKGDDPLNRSGRLKVIKAGLLSKSAVATAGLLALGVACMIPLLLSVNSTVFFLVLLSAACGYCYTGGPWPISYLGLSEFFIFIFYGWVCIITPFYIQTGMINDEIILAASQMGLLAILPNALNNFRDRSEDILINKKTLAVRLGDQFARCEITFLTLFPFLMNFLWIYFGFLKIAFFPLILLPLAVIFIKNIWKTEAGPAVNPLFKPSVMILFFFGLALMMGSIL